MTCALSRQDDDSTHPINFTRGFASMMTTLTKSDLRDSPHEAAVDLIDRARAHLAVFGMPIFTSAGVLENPASARRAVQNAMTLLRQSAALLDE